MALFILAIDTAACPAPLLRRHRLWINPQPIPPLSRFVLSPFPHRISRCMLPIPSASAVFNSCVIDVGVIGQDHISKVRLYLSRPCAWTVPCFPKAKSEVEGLARLVVGLACLRAVDAAEADTFRVLAVQNIESVAIELGDHRPGKLDARHRA
jgi:hypothetical protein